jgi:amino acid transporter
MVPGAAGRFLAFWECSCRAIFTFTGNEIIGMTAVETERQRETLPKAVKRISHRIIFYYIGAILVLSLNLSANDPILPMRVADEEDSTRYYHGGFITMFQRANIPILPHIVNAVMIIAALSVSNADIYVAVIQHKNY